MTPPASTAPGAEDDLLDRLRYRSGVHPIYGGAIAALTAERERAERAEAEVDGLKDALSDLVSCHSEAEALTGGGPGISERWRKAWLQAEELVRVEP